MRRYVKEGQQTPFMDNYFSINRNQVSPNIPSSPLSQQEEAFLKIPNSPFSPFLENFSTQTSEIKRDLSNSSDSNIKLENNPDFKMKMPPPFSINNSIAPSSKQQQQQQQYSQSHSPSSPLHSFMSQEDFFHQMQMFTNYSVCFNQYMQSCSQMLKNAVKGSENTSPMFMPFGMMSPGFSRQNSDSNSCSPMVGGNKFMNTYEMFKQQQQDSVNEQGGNSNRKKKRGNFKNNNREETKNLLKIYSLGFHKFIENTYQEIFGVSKEQIMNYLENNRLKSYTLKGLRQMWERNQKGSQEQQKYNKIVRIYCKIFLQQEAVSYFLTHSRTKNPYIILKYRSILLKHLHKPEELTFLKRRDKEDDEDSSIEDEILEQSTDFKPSPLRISKKIRKLSTMSCSTPGSSPTKSLKKLMSSSCKITTTSPKIQQIPLINCEDNSSPSNNNNNSPYKMEQIVQQFQQQADLQAGNVSSNEVCQKQQQQVSQVQQKVVVNTNINNNLDSSEIETVKI